MITVLFICLGNICRSPMAEALFRHKVAQAGLSDQIRSDSAGTYAGHAGASPHRGTIRELERHAIDWRGIQARGLAAEDIEGADYLLVMDLENFQEVQRLAQGWGFAPLDDLRFLMEFAREGRDGDSLDVPDPYYQRNFDHVYAMLDEATDGLLDYLCQQEKLKKRSGKAPKR